MDSSIFNGQFQMVIYQLLFRLLERYSQGAESSAGQPVEAPPVEGVKVGGQFADLIMQAAERYDVDPRLVKAVIKFESSFNPDAVSPSGAMGLMQLMPGTAKGLGVEDPFDPAQNIDGGVRLLRRLLRSYDNNVELALAAYNAGMGAVKRYGGIPPYQQTQTYIQRIMGFLKSKYNWSA